MSLDISMPISAPSNTTCSSSICQILIETSNDSTGISKNDESMYENSKKLSPVSLLPKRRHSWSKHDCTEDIYNKQRQNSKTNYSGKENCENMSSLISLNDRRMLEFNLENSSNGIRSFKDIINACQNQSKKSTTWGILCKLLNCKVAFKKHHNGKKYNWIQLAGHAGRFIPGDREGYILKLLDNSEKNHLVNLQTDSLSPFVPKIGQIIVNSEDQQNYIELQDLLYKFSNPSMMDIKIGTRTHLEYESSKANEKETKPRKDLYLKMLEIAPNEPSEEEHNMQAITKTRYMTWRESSTCSAKYGFRIEAIKKSQVSEKEFFTVREKSQVMSHFKSYINNDKTILGMYLRRLIDLQNELKKSPFFAKHEMIGTSLLFVHDKTFACIWMIDFGKTRKLPPGIQINHTNKWIAGNHEDGFLTGINNLIEMFNELLYN